MNEMTNYGPLTAHNHPNPFPPAPECHDQLPLISPVGIGIKGDSYRVEIANADEDEFFLRGKYYNHVDQSWTTDWVSENISGGKLKYQYHLRPYTIPQTFTITFALDRPGQPEWSWTTPAIPYIWDADNDGKADVDNIIGVGLSTLFVKKTQDEWDESLWGAHSEAEAHSFQEKTVYPAGWNRDQLNAPRPYEPYAATIDYGVGGDIDAPNITDFAKVLGLTEQQIKNIINGYRRVFIGDGIYGDNIKEYIDSLNTHTHADLGFPGGQLAGDGGTSPRNTVYKWLDELTDDSGFYKNADGSFGEDGLPYFTIDLPADTVAGKPRLVVKAYTAIDYIDAVAELAERNSNNRLGQQYATLAAKVDKDSNTIAAIVSKIFGSNTVNQDGTITWQDGVGKIPIADINIFAGSASPSSTTYANSLRSRNISTNDIKTLK